MKTVDVVIRGNEPLLLHRFDNPQAVDKPTRRVSVERGTPQEQAEKFLYKDERGNLVVPGSAIARLLRDSGGNHKLRGTRKSARYIVPCAVRVKPENLQLTNGDGTTPITSFIVDSRPVTNPSTKGRYLSHRPRFNQWSLRFTLKINEALLEPDFVKLLLVEGGEQCGIGSFRAEKGGPFGTFAVTEWGEVA